MAKPPPKSLAQAQREEIDTLKGRIKQLSADVVNLDEERQHVGQCLSNFVRERLAEDFPGQEELVKEYCDEGQHQDGWMYWTNFPSWSDVVVDFEYYQTASKEE